MRTKQTCKELQMQRLRETELGNFSIMCYPAVNRELLLACCGHNRTLHPDLPRSFCNQVFIAYVRPSVFFGLEFVPEDRQLQRVNTRLFQGAGRHILMWPRGAPTAAVQGRAAWLA